MWGEKLLYLNPNRTGRQQFGNLVGTEGAKYQFELLETLEQPADVDGLNLAKTPTVIVFEGNNIDAMSQLAAKKAKAKYPGIATAVLSRQGYSDWADTTIDLTEQNVDVIKELAEFEH